MTLLPSTIHSSMPGTLVASKNMTDLAPAVRTVVRRCLAVQPGENVVVVVDSTLQDVGEALRDEAESAQADAVLAGYAPQLAAIAQAADRSGFLYVAVCDHVAIPRPLAQAFFSFRLARLAPALLEHWNRHCRRLPPTGALCANADGVVSFPYRAGQTSATLTIGP